MSELIKVLKKLDFLNEVHLVGGCVRDHFLGRPYKDIDAATPTKPELVMQLAKASGFSVIPTGIKHGTVTVLGKGLPKEGVEITTYRRDVKRDSEPFYTHSIVEDLARRDFTMNALAMDENGTILDPFGGTTDLAAGILHTVGLPADRFKEDYLRVIRAVRFSADLNLEFAKKINLSQELFKAAPFVKHNVSVERFVMELNKAWGGNRTGRLVKQLYMLGILQDFIPQLSSISTFKQKPKYHPEGNVLNHIAKVVQQAPPRYRWHALLHDVGKPLVAARTLGEGDYFTFHGHAERGAAMIPPIAKALKMPTWLKEELIVTTQYHMMPLDFWRQGSLSDKTIRRFRSACGEHLGAVEAVVRADRMGRDGPDEEFLDRLFVVKEDEPSLKPVVQGRDLIKAGFKPGPQFTSMLHWCREDQLATGETDANKIVAKLQKVLESDQHQAALGVVEKLKGREVAAV